jgi:hypothetical protein
MPTPDARQAKGQRLVAAGAVSELVAGLVYFVRSESDPKRSYLVQAAVGALPARCTCQDHAHRGGRCAHLWAVRLVLQSARAAHPRPPQVPRQARREPRPYDGWNPLTAHQHQVNALLRRALEAGQLRPELCVSLESSATAH